MRRNLHAGKRRSGGLSLKIFTDDELDEIHLATLEVLEETGLLFDDDEALEILDSGGAIIDKKSKIAKFPPYLVEDAIRSVPSKLFLAGRNPKNDFVMESNRVGFTNFGEGVFIIDPYTGDHRETTKADVAASALLADNLSEIDVYERAVGASDVPIETVQLHNAEAWLPNTSKHGFMGSGNGYLTKKLVEMAAAVTGGKDRLRERPIISFITCPISPLQLVGESCEIIMESARAGLAVNVLSMAMAGGSSPITLAGTLVDHNNDETLAVDVIKEIGVGKDFLSHASTYKHMRTQSQPKLIDRRMREDWQAAGGTDIYQRALEEARHILENHKPDPLPDDVLAAIRAIVEEAEAELGVRAKYLDSQI